MIGMEMRDSLPFFFLLSSFYLIVFVSFSFSLSLSHSHVRVMEKDGGHEEEQ
jgi:hypothetical protein